MVLVWIDYVMLAIPGILVPAWAHTRIARAMATGAKITSDSGRSGAETAALILQSARVPGVEIEPASGELSNHYDSARGSLRLSRDVFEGRSLTAVALAAHEVGHAIQHAEGYAGLMFRNATVPLAGLGTQVCWILLAAGLWLGMMRLIVLALVLFWLLLIVQLANVPVELDATRRARTVLRSTGLVTDAEDQLVARVANAAAWTYVAAVLWGTGGRSTRPQKVA